MNSINKYLLDRALPLGLCEEWAEQLTTATIADMLKMYVKGIDFCLANNFPSNNDLKRLGGSKLDEHGIHIDNLIDLDNQPFAVLLGDCRGTIEVSEHMIIQVFIKHKSKVQMIVSDHAFAVIDCFDSCELDVQVGNNAKVLINVYGKAMVHYKTSDHGIVKLINKLKKTY